MKSIELDLPKWSPKWLADKKDGQPNNVPSAALHGLLFPLLIFLHFVKTLGIGKVAGFGTILSLIWSAILSTDQRSVVRTLLTLMRETDTARVVFLSLACRHQTT